MNPNFLIFVVDQMAGFDVNLGGHHMGHPSDSPPFPRLGQTHWESTHSMEFN